MCIVYFFPSFNFQAVYVFVNYVCCIGHVVKSYFSYLGIDLCLFRIFSASILNVIIDMFGLCLSFCYLFSIYLIFLLSLFDCFSFIAFFLLNQPFLENHFHYSVEILTPIFLSLTFKVVYTMYYNMHVFKKDKICVYFRCTVCFDTHMYSAMIITVKLINTFISHSYKYHFWMWWEHLRYTFSKFPVFSTLLYCWTWL